MDQNKIGNLIKELRKKNNLTQEKFAERYGVTYQAVSKWENGKNIPDISLLKQICDDYNININELLNGEVGKKKMKKKYIIILLFILFIFSICMLVIFSKRDNDSFEFKTLTSSCSNFNISGNISYNTKKSAIYISNINYCGGDDSTRYDEIECILYEEVKEKKIEISSYTYEKEEKITLEDFLKNVTFVIDNYNKVCRDYSNNTLNLVIKAKVDNKTVNYEIPLSINDSC